MKNRTPNLYQKKQKGQILVLMGLLFIGLVAVVGLALDMGLMFVAYSRLNRAVDAAALAATGEFKRHYLIDDMRAAAMQLLQMNDVDTSNTTAIDIDTCATQPGDAELCTTPQRKLVRVTVHQDVPLYFLSVVGIPSVPIEAKAVSEAASLDVVLVVDHSTSMTENNPKGTGIQVRAPKICNESDPLGTSSTTPSYDSLFTAGPDGLPGECHPFEEVKYSAISFVSRLDFQYDRMGVVVFDRSPHMGEIIGSYVYSGIPLTGNVTDNTSTAANETDAAQQAVTDAIKNMTVYEGSGKCPWDTSNKSTFPNDDAAEQCSIYLNDGITYWSQDCPNTNQPPYDPSRCTSSNIGGGLALAGNALAGNYGSMASYLPYIPLVRKESVWVVILIGDGNANAGYAPDPICPSYTWLRRPQCRDKDPYTRHTSTDTSNYDPDDYARDMADIVAGNSVYLFTIGLGSKLDTTDEGSLASWPCDSTSLACAPGQELMQYIAFGAANAVNQHTFVGSFYHVGTDVSQLENVFLDIYNKLTTKLTK
jgi:Flp pilus assembly protein TadG